MCSCTCQFLNDGGAYLFLSVSAIYTISVNLVNLNRQNDVDDDLAMVNNKFTSVFFLLCRSISSSSSLAYCMRFVVLH